ncbi:hypothetical protein HZA96_03825 [Candidatus Woesearchaeota archaeon]|nr:hypothetical protein [Candidatus Woesearchaeota archaeon]
MRYKNKKAQGALEFLMTYGWAFLVILIMIGALAYFGVLNPTKFLPDRCNFGTELSCKKGEFVINAADANTIIVKLTNQFGTSIRVYGAIVTSDIEGFPECTFKLGADEIQKDAPKEGETTKFVWKDGESKELIADCIGASALLTPGDKVKIGVEFKWYPATSSQKFAKTISGELFTGIQEGAAPAKP